MNLVEYITDQFHWSLRTFGPGKRTQGVIEHIKEELKEIEEDPEVLEEWIDVIILALDGAWRHGHSTQDIVDALVEKQNVNLSRSFPDWRDFSEDEKINHIRTTE